ncbi:MAG: excinuclease ABC subunit UvrA [Christensenellales bacterium]
MDEYIKVIGAKENNLKNINVTLPRNKLIVFTGVSGSGKSTLAFDTIFAEGQRKFMESLSTYARQFLGQMQKPNVELIEGLSPSIAIDQKSTSQNPRSTVGTVTEIYDYLRLLYANIGVPYCVNCHKPIKRQTVDQIVDKVKEINLGEKILIEAPVVKQEKGTFAKFFESLKKSGYIRVKVDDNIYTLDEEISLDKNIKHTINVVLDRIILKEDSFGRIEESIENAIKLSEGKVIIEHNGEEILYSTNFACPECGYSYSEISPRLFSFNNPFGACPECSGLGFKQQIDESLILSKPNLTLREGALTISGWNLDSSANAISQFIALSKKYGFSMDVPVKELPKDIIHLLLYGTNEEIEVSYKSKKFETKYNTKFEGVIPNLERRFRETTSDYIKSEIQKYMKTTPCNCCHGKKLNKEALNVFINKKNIADFCDMSIDEASNFIDNLKLNKTEEIIVENIFKEIKTRFSFLKNVGLNYLTLSRGSATLSGGESQRIRLATQIGSGLVGVLYILDEPSIGLHQKDNDKLIDTLKKLRDLGNTIIVVEHDEDTIRSADYIVDIGKYAGKLGGEVVAQGTLEEILKSKDSITAKFLRGEDKIEIPTIRRKTDNGFIEIVGANLNNLKNINVKIPLKTLTVVTGVSGSGKSTLVNDTLFPNVYNLTNKKEVNSFVGCKKVLGVCDDTIDKVINIDQTPIGRTPRSNPATYTGLFTYIRELFAQVELSKMRGYNQGRFSFNVAGGRCEACQGDGIKKIEMYFLPDVYVPCEVCKGHRYNRETLEVKFKGKTIADVLEMTIEEALEFFENFTNIKNKLQTLVDVGLGYIKLGQSATTLSGGEAQRVKLATELCRKSTGKTLYILDEPTTGLHIYDVKKLSNILQRLVDAGNTCVVIEHNLDIIKTADYIIDLGKDGGDNGGTIIATGTPEEIAKNKESYTGIYLKKILKNN